MTNRANKNRDSRKKSAVFGAALSSLFISSEIQADILDFTMDGGNQSVVVEFNDDGPVNLDQLFGNSELDVINYSFVTGVGSYFSSTFTFQTLAARNYLACMTSVSIGDTVDTAILNADQFVYFGGVGSGQHVAFKTRENNVGWFRLSLQNGNDLVIEAGELATAGESLTVGGTAAVDLLGDANCDGVVNLLDVSTFIDQIASGAFEDKSDMNRDGVVNLLDVEPFTAVLNGAGTAIVDNGELRIRTTTRDDVITVARVVDKIRVTVNGTQLGDFTAVDRIFIDARQGNDSITIQPTIDLDTTIYAGPGDDTVFGGSGDDNIFGAQGNDLIYGRDGDDYIVGAAGTNEIYGQDGDDEIFGGQIGILSGGNGNDRITGGELDDDISGDAGDDDIDARGGDDTVRGGTGDDDLSGGNGDDTLMGDGGADVMFGGFGSDLMFGGAGNDSLLGLNGDDTICGDAGDDSIFGGSGLDLISGDDGNDSLYGNGPAQSFDAEANQIFGGAGDDVLFSTGPVGDLLFGETGNDELRGQSADDMLNGGPHDDILMGFGGDDYIFGAAGNDILAGGQDNDFLNGGADIDIALDFGETGHINIEIDP